MAELNEKLINYELLAYYDEKLKAYIGDSDSPGSSDLPIAAGEGENSLVANDLENNRAIGPNSVALGTNTIAAGPNAWATGMNTVAGARGYYYSCIDFDNNQIYLTDVQVTPSIEPADYGTKAIDIGIPVGAPLSIDNYYKYEDCVTVSAVDSENGIITFEGTLPFTGIQVPENIKYNDFVVRSSAHPTIGLTSVGENAFAFGNGAVSSGEGSYSEGYLTEARGDYCHAEGRETVAIGNASHVEGRNNTASGYASHAQGQDNTVTGTEAHVGGRYSNSLAPYSFVHGYKSTVTETGNKSFAGGNEVTVSGENSFGFGSGHTVSGKGVGVFGYNHTVSGNRAFAVGQDNIAYGDRTFVAGQETKAYGSYSTALGYNTITGVVDSKTTGQYALAGGNGSLATGTASLAFGQNCQATDNRTIALGQDNISQGMRTIALGEGLITGTSAGQKGQLVAGRYNADVSNALFILGRGTSDSDRRNAFEVRCEKHSGTKTEVTLKVGDTLVTETQLANIGSGGMNYLYGTATPTVDQLEEGQLYFQYTE